LATRLAGLRGSWSGAGEAAAAADGAALSVRSARSSAGRTTHGTTAGETSDDDDARGSFSADDLDDDDELVRQAAATQVEKLDDLVERRRVTRSIGADRKQICHGAELVRRKLRLPGAHPVAVSLNGIDLAIVGNETERVSQRPRRERVR
jgi:hypothetical protein